MTKDAAEGKLDFILILSPSVAIIDAWMPVLYELREKQPQCKIGVLIPDDSTLKEIDPSNYLIQNLKKYVCAWYKCISQKNKLSYAPVDSRTRASGRHQTLTERSAISFRPRTKYTLDDIASPTCSFLYDINELKNKNVRGTYEQARERRWYSIPHGSDLRNRTRQAEKYKLDSDAALKGICFLPAQQETKTYSDRYGVHKGNMVVSGIPKHDPFWLKSCAQKTNPAQNHGRYCLVISRNSSSSYFPLHEKIRVLTIIKHVASENGLKVVVKRHPKEDPDDGFSAVFGRGNGRVAFTQENYLPLAQNASVVFSFFSSVALDLICINVPVIEPINFSQCVDTPKLWRDDQGLPISQYQYYGFVIKATTKEQVNRWLEKIEHNRAEVGINLRNRYLSVYKDPTNSPQLIAQKILSDRDYFVRNCV